MAVTDPLCIIAQPLETVDSKEVLAYIEDYIKNNEVEKIVIGMPTQLDGSPSESQKYIRPFIGRLKKITEDMQIIEVEEAGTSVEAFEAMIEGGVSKMKRRQKSGIVDRTAASLILQRYLSSLENF